MWQHFKRDVLMFALGAGGFIHELIFETAERPTVLFVCCALMGLPFVLNGRGNGKAK